MADYPAVPPWVAEALRDGLAIPAHPLALTAARRLDARRQRALTRYYLDAGAGGLAVGVHSTQFEIRDPRYGLYQPVLALAAETIAAWEQTHGRRIVRIAGLCGRTEQAVREAELARELGYHAGLLSLGAMAGATPPELLTHARRVAQVMPLFGFYLQPAAGGILLPYTFWREMTELPNLAAIKIAPFNRYQTLDVVRAVAQSGRGIPLYTGNDDHILLDLLCAHALIVGGEGVRVTMRGGLLGHWACWTKRAVEQLALCRAARDAEVVPAELLTLALQVTDCNAAIFDAAHGYSGALCGIHEVLRRQGLLDNVFCLDERQTLSPGQAEEIERVWRAYPGLNDDGFVAEGAEGWLA
jgi:dihydrodipicolinate synthase/N-acetylneuraminate lyase